MKTILSAFCLQLIIFFTLSFIPEHLSAQCGSLTASVSSVESRCVATGSIIINASGGLAPENYQYLISDGPVTTTYSSIDTFSGLPPGTYTVVIKDVTANCTITDSNIVVPGNYIVPGIFYNSTAPACMNGSDGTIFVTGQSGGRAPFSYQIIAPSPSQVGTISSTGSFTGLMPGLYYIQMTDSCGGIQTRSQLVNNYTWSILNSSSVINNCQTITADIFLTSSNGINSPDPVYAGFQYGISRFPGDTTWFSFSTFSFDIGSYRSAEILVKDNCGNIQSFPWVEPAATVNANVSISNKTCATFTATITGQQNLSTSNTQYCLFDSSNINLISACQSSPEFDSIPYGTYTIRITDSCYDTTIIRTFTAVPPSPSIDNNPLFLYSCGNFSAAITGQNDTANSMYCLYENSNLIPDTCNTTGIFDSLTYGVPYCIQLHTSSACYDTTIIRCFTVGKQLPLVNGSINFSNKTCSSFTATVTGQTNIANPIYRLFNNTNDTQIGSDQTSPEFDSLPYGSYCIDIINDSTCYDTTIIRCFTESPPVINISLSAKGSCSIVGTTDIKVNINSGVAPFTIMIYSPGNTLLNTVVSSTTSYTFDNLPELEAGDTYKIIATDSCGNQDSSTIASKIYYFNRNITTIPKCPTGSSPNGSSDVIVVVSENRGGNFITTIIQQNGTSFNQNPNSAVNSGNTHTYTFLSLPPDTYIFDTYSQSCNIHLYDTVTITGYVYPNLSNSKGYICDNSSQTVNSIITDGLGPFQYQIFGSTPDSPVINTPYQSTPDFVINNGTPYSLIRIRVLDACANASINDVGFISVATPAVGVYNTCVSYPSFLFVDSVANSIHLWYKRIYNPIDSILLDSGSVYEIPSLSLSDSGTYISKTIINSGCEVRMSYFDIDPVSLCSVVPVKLQNLDAIKENDHSLLNWTTSNELNIKEFIIERSTDNGKTWKSIGKVTASANNTVKKDYSFTDESPESGINLYRLQMEDNNKNLSYSNIVQVEIQNESLISVYPNPVGKKDVLNIEFTGLKAGVYKISMTSSSGQIVKEITFDITNSVPALLPIPLMNISSGNYEIILKGNDERYSKQVTVTNR